MALFQQDLIDIPTLISSLSPNPTDQRNEQRLDIIFSILAGSDSSTMVTQILSLISQNRIVKSERPLHAFLERVLARVRDTASGVATWLCKFPEVTLFAFLLSDDSAKRRLRPPSTSPAWSGSSGLSWRSSPPSTSPHFQSPRRRAVLSVF
jgi:hypothetical protein